MLDYGWKWRYHRDDMNAFDAKEIASHFGFEDINEVHEISSGHINATYRLDTGKGRFILQRVNTSIFADPGRMMENISIVLGKIPRLFLVPALDGRPYYENGSGFYRVYNFIEDSITYGKVESEDMAWKMGRALREFHSALASVDGSALYETIPHFHDMSFRLEQFEDALSEDRAGRAASVMREIGFIRENGERASRISSMYNGGLLPRRVTHNDAKLQNMLFSRTSGEFLAFIDLDTVMPGTILFDTGDMMRTGCSLAEEDEENLEKVRFSIPFFQAMREGYLSLSEGMITEMESSLFNESGMAITFIMALRFLTDYLNGDTYFRIDRPDHNLIRARNQIRLIEEMEKHQII